MTWFRASSPICRTYRSVARFRVVCKSWRDCIARAFLPPPVPAVVSVQETEATADGLPRTVVRFGLCSALCRAVDGVPLRIPPGPSLYAVSFTSALRCSSAVLGSWDGVLCIERSIAYDDVQYVLCNPITGACAAVRGPASRGLLIGAYAHPVTKRFHLLHVSGERADKTYQLQTVGDEAGWREVHNTGESISASRRNHLNDNLYWLGVPCNQRLATVVAFDMAREEFRPVRGPNAVQPAGTTTRLCVLPCPGDDGDGNLCILTVTPRANAMDMWVLEEFSTDKWRWKLARRIALDGEQNLPLMFAMADMVEVLDEERVEADGEELLVHLNGHVAAYNFRREAWRRLRLLPTFWRLMTHKERVVEDQISFGPAARVLPVTDIDGQLCYCLPWEQPEPDNSDFSDTS